MYLLPLQTLTCGDRVHKPVEPTTHTHMGLITNVCAAYVCACSCALECLCVCVCMCACANMLVRLCGVC